MKSTPKAPLRMAMGHRLGNLPCKACLACPDTGASCNVLSEREANRMHLKWKRSKVSLTNASGANMKVLGKAEVYCAAKNGGTKKICVIISSDLVDNMLLGWQSQIVLGMLHLSWPNVLCQAKCNQVNHEEEKG